MDIQKIKISEHDRIILSSFMGEDYPIEVDYNWLMPVVRRIIEICTSEEEIDGAFESDQYTSILDIVPLAVIEDSYKVVIEFIKWYNENKFN